MAAERKPGNGDVGREEEIVLPRRFAATFTVVTVRTYRVQARDKEPLLKFILDALSAEGCRVLHHSPPDEAPFRITFETLLGERQRFLAAFSVGSEW